MNPCLSNQNVVTLPKPTEMVDTTLRLGPAAQSVNVSCSKPYRRKSYIDLSQVTLRRPRRYVSISLIWEEGEDDIHKPVVTLSVYAVTITPVAPAIFSNNQLRSLVLSSGRTTI
jgi:hypothetical protein